MSTASPSSPNTSTLSVRQIPIVCPGHSRPLAEVQYSPLTNEKRCYLISACHDKLPMLRRGDTGDWIGTFEGHKGAVWSAKIDCTGEYAATGSADFSVKLWDATTGDIITTFEHNHVVKCVTFTKDATQLITVGHEKLIRIFDLLGIKEQVDQYKTDGRTGITLPPPRDGPILELQTKSQLRKVVVLASDMFATGEIDGTIRIWKLSTGDCLKEFHVDSKGVMDMENSRDGTILTVAAGKVVYFYDVLNDFALLHSYEMPMSFAEEGGCSLHPTADTFIAGGSDTYVRVFVWSTGEVLDTHKGHHGPVRCLRYAPDGESFASGSEDGTIRIWQSDSTSAAAASVVTE